MSSVWKSIEPRGLTAAATATTAATLILAGAAPAGAQAPSAGGGGAPGMTATGPSGGLFESTSGLELQRRIFDTDSDSVDFQEGTLNHKGKTFNLGQSRLVRARFERYLNYPTDEAEVAEYRAVIEEIKRRLSAQNGSRNFERNLEDAWSLLFEAAEFKPDGGTSLIIANHVYNVWRIRDEHKGSNISKLELERKRRYEQSIVANRTRHAQRKAEEIARLEGRRTSQGSVARIAALNSGNGGGAASGGGDSPDEAAFRALELMETQAQIAALKLEMASSALQAKVQFQSAIVGMLMGRKFEHALIACDFYRATFKGSAQALEGTALEDLAGLLPSTDTIDTVDSLRYIAQEAVADAGRGMETVNNAYDNEQRMAALERLQETFFLGEHLAPVMRFPNDRKQDLLIVYKKAREAQQLADIKDFEGVEAAVERVREVAPDFPATQVIAAVRSAKRVSNLELFAAKAAMAREDSDEVKAALQRATEAWPLNPAIEAFTNGVLNVVDDTKRAIVLFDELRKNGTFRQLYEHRAELGVGLRNEPERAAYLKRAVDAVAAIEFALAQCREALAQDNPFAAWELVEHATQFDPQDVVLNQTKAEVAPYVAGYTRLLKMAGDEEAKGDYATSLNNFLSAQDLYPASKICRLGIERTSEELLRSLGPQSTPEGGDPGAATAADANAGPGADPS